MKITYVYSMCTDSYYFKGVVVLVYTSTVLIIVYECLYIHVCVYVCVYVQVQCIQV